MVFPDILDPRSVVLTSALLDHLRSFLMSKLLLYYRCFGAQTLLLSGLMVYGGYLSLYLFLWLASFVWMLNCLCRRKTRVTMEGLTKDRPCE
jgi:hypothetical protein